MADPTENQSNSMATPDDAPIVMKRRGLKPEPTRQTEFPDLISVTRKRDAAHLVELGEDLRAIATTTEEYGELIQRFLEAAVFRGRLLSIAWIEFAKGKKANVVRSSFKNMAMNNQTTMQILVDSAAHTLVNRRPQILDSERIRGTLTACVPVFVNESTTAVVCGVFPDTNTRSGESLAVCQSVANHFDLWRSRDQMTEMATEVRSVASVLELVGKTENNDTLKGACVTVANELQKFLRCDYVAVGIKKKDASACKLMAVSSLSDFDNQSRTTTLIRSAFDEANLQGSLTCFPDLAGNQKGGSSLLHQKLARHLRCEAAITTPLRNQDEEIVGAVTILGNRRLAGNPAICNLIRSMEHPIGSSLEVVRIAQGGWLRRISRTIVSGEKTNMKWAVAALMLITTIAMFVQTPYRIASNCVAEPVARSFSAAPFEGLLENTYAEPGDVVEKGQLLAEMDGRDLRSRIAEVVALKNRAAQERDSYLASHETSKEMQAKSEEESRQAELRVLQNRMNNLKIKSRVNGVVLAGSIDKRENYPVTLGQTLYEIAPISPLRVELAIPADEIMHVKVGQLVKFRFDGFGTETLEGKVKTIRPSSTIRDEENVFIAEAILPNEDGTVRPGMKGKARVYGESRSLGWSLFHRPWEKIVHVVGL